MKRDIRTNGYYAGIDPRVKNLLADLSDENEKLKADVQRLTVVVDALNDNGDGSKKVGIFKDLREPIDDTTIEFWPNAAEKPVPNGNFTVRPTDDKPEARHKDYGDNKSAITWKGKVDLGQVDKLPSYEATLPTVRTDDTHRTVEWLRNMHDGSYTIRVDKFDDPDEADYWVKEISSLVNQSSTHRTVILRIPKGMRTGQAISNASNINIKETVGGKIYTRQEEKFNLFYISDDDLIRALEGLQE